MTPSAPTLRRAGLLILAIALAMGVTWLHTTNRVLRTQHSQMKGHAAELSAELAATRRDSMSTADELSKLQRGAAAEARRMHDQEERYRKMCAFLAEEKARPGGVRRPHGLPVPSGSGGLFFHELMSDAGYAERMAKVERWQIEASQAELFQQLGLDAPALDRFKRLLVEQQLMGSDLANVAAKYGLSMDSNDRSSVMQLRQRLWKMMEEEAREILGEVATARYEQYQASSGARETVTAFSNRLSYSQQPLRPDQAEQMVDLLRGTRGWHPGLRSTRIDVITDDQLARAAQILSPVQLQELRVFREEQMASIMKRR